jgi:GPH family glycoside/pentoside/hexuronide:cation symporter
VFIILLISSFLADRKVKLWGLKHIYITGLVLASIGLMLLFFSGNWLIPVIVSFAVMGIGLGPVNLIWGPLLADVMDYDEILTGKRRETTYAGMNALITKPAISIGNALFLLIISGFGFDNTESLQTDLALFGIQLGYTLVPAVFLIISAITLFKWYKLDGKDWLANKAELAKIHLKKEREYIETLQREGKISKIYQRLH